MRRKTLVSKIRLHNLIMDRINVIDYKSKLDLTEEERYLILGEEDALNKCSSMNRKAILKEVAEGKIQLKEMMYDLELFELDIKYIEGYIRGCKLVLDYQREIIENSKPIKIIAYAQDETVKNIIGVLLKSIGFRLDGKEESNFIAFVSCDIDELNSFEEEDSTRLIFVIKPSGKPPKISKDLKNEIRTLDANLKAYNKESISIDQIFTSVRNLNEFWYSASYIYLENIISIQSLITSINKSISL